MAELRMHEEALMVGERGDLSIRCRTYCKEQEILT